MVHLFIVDCTMGVELNKHMDFAGVLIQESLTDKSILREIKIVSTTVEQVTPEHKTPWVDHWTMHDVEIAEGRVVEIAEKIRSNRPSPSVGASTQKLNTKMRGNDGNMYKVIRTSSGVRRWVKN